MAITFIQERKKQKYLFVIFILLILTIIFIFQLKPFAKTELTVSPQAFEAKKVRINLEALKNPAIEELQSFEEIPQFEEEIGRENPFLPY